MGLTGSETMGSQDLKSLADLYDIGGGVVPAMYAEGIEQVVADIENRPGVEKAREVILIARFTPKVASRGAMGDVEVEFEVKVKGPPSRSATYKMRAVGGALTFNSDSLDNVDQGTLDDEAARAREERNNDAS